MGRRGDISVLGAASAQGAQVDEFIKDPQRCVEEWMENVGHDYKYPDLMWSWSNEYQWASNPDQWSNPPLSNGRPSIIATQGEVLSSTGDSMSGCGSSGRLTRYFQSAHCFQVAVDGWILACSLSKWDCLWIQRSCLQGNRLAIFLSLAVQNISWLAESAVDIRELGVDASCSGGFEGGTRPRIGHVMLMLSKNQIKKTR